MYDNDYNDMLTMYRICLRSQVHMRDKIKKHDIKCWMRNTGKYKSKNNLLHIVEKFVLSVYNSQFKSIQYEWFTN